MIPFILAVVLVVGGTLLYVALRNAQDFSDANEIIPGVPTRAPKEWAGAHSTEARLHRRLRDAMEALRANAAMDDAALAHVRTALEEQALATDERLVAAAALPKGRREEPIGAVGETVETIEGLVASLVELRGPALGDIERQIDDVRVRVELLARARSELAAFDPVEPDLSALRAQLEAERGAPGEPGPASAPGTPTSEPDDHDGEPGSRPST